MVAIAPGDMVTIKSELLTIVSEGDVRVSTFEIMQFNIRHFIESGCTTGRSCSHEIASYLCLTVNHH
ncbi:hypothetical protein D3C76_1653560 [compost metagenome]